MPKDHKSNLLWRRSLRKECTDPDIRDSILWACTQSFLFWCNAFVWTFRQKEVGPDGNERAIIGAGSIVPFITWPVQDEAAEEIILCVRKGHDLNLEKSRDMGASWLVLTIIDWFLLFRKSVQIGVVSRKESLVDAKGDMDSLFEKIRFIHNHLPVWMVPKIHDRYMYMRNMELGAAVTGESTNTDVGRGGRKAFYFVDEGAAIPNGEEIESSLSQNTACQLWVSTPKGPNTAFHKRLKSGRGRRFQLPWWRHPEKSRGAYQIFDATGRVKWTSPWYAKLADRYSAKTIAQEVDMDHGQAGDMFFDYTELERHRQDHESAPMKCGRLIPIDEMTPEARVLMIQRNDADRFVMLFNKIKGPWRFWTDLPNGRPPQHWTYCFGVDISNGAGASNSVITVISREIGAVVAKFWDAYTSPEELAMLAAAAGVWFGGQFGPAFICWENNGPGGIFGRKLLNLDYPNYYRQRVESAKSRPKTPRFGWNSNNAKKEVMLGMYRDAIGSDQLINPCKESLDEAAEYIYDGSGGIIPSILREEKAGGRALHGDHCIADGLAWHAMTELPLQRRMQPRARPGTFAHRRMTADRKKREDPAWAR